MYPTTPRTTPHRHRDRMHYDRDTAHAVIDEALHCHLAFTVGGEPRILPTLHVRVGDTLYLHASTGSRPMIAARAGGLPVCVAVTLLDGLVLARSQFHHSANYRSVVVHGTARLVDDPDDRARVFAVLVDKIAAGRSADTRPPTDKELAQTAVMAIRLDEVATKVRTGDVADDEGDLGLPYWAGVVPLRVTAGTPVPAAGVSAPLPPYLIGYRAESLNDPWLTAEPLRGKLVHLEPLSMAHVDGLFEASRDPEVWQWLSTIHPRTRDEMADWVVEALDTHRGKRVTWVQVEAATGRVIGSTSYYEPDPRNRTVAIGYTFLGRPWWRSGINTEAKVLLMERAFDTLGALRVVWHTDIRNERSQRAIERLGATREAVLRNHKIRPDGTLRDSVQYAMTADEWPANRGRLRARLEADRGYGCSG